MLNLGLFEILTIMALALVTIGPERLPEVVRFLGKQYGRLLRTSNDLRRAFMLEAERGDMERRAEAMRKRREETRRRLEEQKAAMQANDHATPEVDAVASHQNPFSPQPPAPPAASPSEKES